MRKVVSGVGGFSHERWRSFHSEHRGQATESRGFVDGDLVESFLDLRREKAEEVAATVKVSVEELTKLSRSSRDSHTDTREEPSRGGRVRPRACSSRRIIVR